MRVMLIGASGQLGSDIKSTCPEGVELITTTRKEVDITNRESLIRAVSNFKPSVIINTAAFHKTDECESKEELAFLVNAIGVKYLVEASELVKAKLVHISTDYVFDGKKANNKEPYYESDIPNPLNIYGLSKYAGELILKNYTDNYIIVRVSSLFGLRGSREKRGNFVYTILEIAREKKTIRVVNDIFMTPTYCQDAAVEIWKLVLNEESHGTYHITNGGVCSWYEFAREIVNLAGLDTTVEPVSHRQFPTKAERPLWSPLASERGIKLRHWKEALKSFFQEIRGRGYQ